MIGVHTSSRVSGDDTGRYRYRVIALSCGLIEDAIEQRVRGARDPRASPIGVTRDLAVRDPSLHVATRRRLAVPRRERRRRRPRHRRRPRRTRRRRRPSDRRRSRRPLRASLRSAARPSGGVDELVGADHQHRAGAAASPRDQASRATIGRRRTPASHRPCGDPERTLAGRQPAIRTRASGSSARTIASSSSRHHATSTCHRAVAPTDRVESRDRK